MMDGLRRSSCYILRMAVSYAVCVESLRIGPGWNRESAFRKSANPPCRDGGLKVGCAATGRGRAQPRGTWEGLPSRAGYEVD